MSSSGRPDPHPQEDSGCSGGESFALRVLGEDMLPEFREGDIIVVEPDGALKDGCFVLACPDGAWMLRQLVRRDGGWLLRVLNPPACSTAPELAIADLSTVRGLVIQKAVPGRRRLTRSYL
ncbi:S24 family peptidase [Ramlibacter sp. AN1133]|uniref:S24 family peptidase n=1 Tax=Ramlibacter sp. AN1133 TaxID=3133429 RepID=UPI0030C5A392